jgi:GT2 family glycosyltransferase
LRGRRDFAAADAIRDRLRAGGWEVVDGEASSELRKVDLPPPARAVSLLTVLHGWPDDSERWLESVLRHHQAQREREELEVVLVDNSGDPDVAGWAATRCSAEVRLLTIPPAGFGAAVNAGLHSTAGSVVILFDPGTEATGDLVTPLLAMLEQPGVGLAAAFGVRAISTVKHFHDHPGPEVDAVEGYCMAFRRADALAVGGFDERFKFYRIADFDFSFRIRDTGQRAMVLAGLPLRKHEHRLWEAQSAAERDRLSRKNFYRFLDRWSKRTDLLLG